MEICVFLWIYTSISEPESMFTQPPITSPTPHSSPQFDQHLCFPPPVYMQQLWTTHLSKLSNICGFLIWFWFLYTWGCVYETKPSYYSPPGPSLPRHFQSDTPTYFSSVSLSIWIFIKKTFLVQTWKSPFIFLLQPFHPQTVVNFLNNIVRRKETFREKIFWLCWVSLFSGHSLLLICGQLS